MCSLLSLLFFILWINLGTIGMRRFASGEGIDVVWAVRECTIDAVTPLVGVSKNPPTQILHSRGVQMAYHNIAAPNMMEEEHILIWMQSHYSPICTLRLL